MKPTHPLETAVQREGGAELSSGGRGKPSATAARALPVVRVAIAILLAKRVVYHLSYLATSPFALATFSDGQLYERAARDIVEHGPLGQQPFYLQGIYAALLALPMALGTDVIGGLLLQLLVAGACLWLFHRAAIRAFGALAGAISTATLLAFFELSYYENKYLSVSLGVSLNIAAVYTFVRYLDAPSPRRVLWVGLLAGLSVLGRPNMLVALPFTALSLVGYHRHASRPWLPGTVVFALGVAMALAPMALRNQLVLGDPHVTPSHGGGIPFYIGNNPHANGRWNTAGGLLSGQVHEERSELLTRLGIEAAGKSRAQLDREVGDKLFAQGRTWILDNPGTWLRLSTKKLWMAVGNHAYVRDYDMAGERQSLGAAHHLGLPFSIVLGLGTLGLGVLVRRPASTSHGPIRQRTLALMLSGQVLAVLAANALIFTSAQNRVPLAVPLAFVAGPGLLGLGPFARRLRISALAPSPVVVGVALLLALQGLWPRTSSSSQPSAAHYFNLASVEEYLGRDADAAENYARAVELAPRQPVFRLRHVRALLRIGRIADARRALDVLESQAAAPLEVRRAAAELRTHIPARRSTP
ncbi:MAG: hypothetical protein OEZ06_11520 [Myxococcales bacterium]|nr:hypothetical protein [Myxococcales bacterium]